MQPGLDRSGVGRSGHRVDAQGRTSAEIDQPSPVVPDQRPAQPPVPRPVISLADRRPGNDATGLPATGTGRDHGRQAVGGDHRIHQIDRDQPGPQGGIVHHPFAHQPLDQIAALFHARQHDGAVRVARDPGVEGGGNVAPGKGPGLARVVAQRQPGVEAALAKARGADTARSCERPGVVGQNDALQPGVGLAVIDWPVPLPATVIGGRMQKEDRRRSRARPACVTQRPGRRIAIVGGGRRRIGLERHLRVQPGSQDVTAPYRHRRGQHQNHRQAGPADPLAQAHPTRRHR